MDLGFVANKMREAAKKHPSRRTVTLLTKGTSYDVPLAILHTESWRQGGSEGIFIVQDVRYVLLKEYCPVEPTVGDVIQDHGDSYSIQAVDSPYGGLAYSCMVDKQL